MPTPRPSLDAVLRMACQQARHHAALPLAEQARSPAMVQAIGQTWELVRQRLGSSDEVTALDALIRQITAPAPGAAKR